MANYTKGIDLYRAQLARFEKVNAGARHAHRMIAEEGERDLRDLLSGRLTPRQTRGAFARGSNAAASTATGRRRALSDRQKRNRGLKGSVPLFPINVQSGRLRRGIKRGALSRPGAVQAFGIGVDGVAYAQYVLAVGGTSKMVSRQVQREIKRRWRPRNKAFVDHLRAMARTP